MLSIAEGWIGDTKRRIDAFLWFQASSGRLSGAVINRADKERELRVSALLSFDPAAIS